MSWRHRARKAISDLFHHDRIEREMDEEIESFLDMSAEEQERAGTTPREACRAARARFGGVEAVKEDLRDMRVGAALYSVARDLRHSARFLWKDRVFSFGVVTILALCIGANTAVLSGLYSLILRPLPVANADRVVQLFNFSKDAPSNSFYSASSWNQYRDLKQRADLLEAVTLRQSVTELLTRGSEVQLVRGHKVTADFFDFMGAKPVLGRFFTPEEADPAGPGDVIILTQSAWESDYGADRGVIGSQLRIDDMNAGAIHCTIIGVAPRNLETFDAEAKYFAPFRFFNKDISNPATARYLSEIDLWLRLREGVGRQAALSQIRAIERHWYEEVADASGRRGYERGGEVAFDLPHPLEKSLYLLEAGSLMILLACCFNVAILVLGRVQKRDHELSIRSALGAGKWTLRRLMLVESAQLIGAATVAGLALACVGIHLANQYLAVISPKSLPVELDSAVLAATLVVTGGVMIVMGLVPFEVLWKTGLLHRPDNAQQTASQGSFARSLNDGMTVAQIAVAFVLVIGAGLLVRSFQNVIAVDPGFAARQIVQGRLDWRTIYPFYKGRTGAAALKRRIHDAMLEIPGVESVGFSMAAMLGADGRTAIPFQLHGEPKDPSRLRLGHMVSPDFFETMGIPILEGRGFNSSDDINSVIIDESFARRYFKDRNPIGAEMSIEDPHPTGEPWERIVGVSGRANFQGLEQRDGAPIVYIYNPVDHSDWEYTIFLRTSRPAGAVVRDMRVKLREIDPRLPLSDAGSLDEALDNQLVARRLMTVLLASFAALALLLSLIGVYAVLTNNVLRRRREFGIRIALGAPRPRVCLGILASGLMKALVGLALGSMGTIALGRLLTGLLFDVASLDPLTYAAAISVFLLTAAVASALPAWRAAAVDPIRALRLE